MIDVRSFSSLGRFQNDWLNARHHFSFGGYHDPARMGWGALRVWNDDEIAPHTGFAPHPHRDMEIITYVRTGAITHADSMGNEGRTGAGDVQVMSAGTGVVHSEYNREDELTTLFQIWIEPDQLGGAPSWDAAAFPKADRAGELVTLASGRPGDDGLPIRADAAVLGGLIPAGTSVEVALDPSRRFYLATTSGALTVTDAAGGEAQLGARDGAAVSSVEGVTITAREDAELVAVDSR